MAGRLAHATAGLALCAVEARTLVLGVHLMQARCHRRCRRSAQKLLTLTLAVARALDVAFEAGGSVAVIPRLRPGAVAAVLASVYERVPHETDARDPARGIQGVQIERRLRLVHRVERPADEPLELCVAGDRFALVGLDHTAPRKAPPEDAAPALRRILADQPPSRGRQTDELRKDGIRELGEEERGRNWVARGDPLHEVLAELELVLLRRQRLSALRVEGCHALLQVLPPLLVATARLALLQQVQQAARLRREGRRPPCFVGEPQHRRLMHIVRRDGQEARRRSEAPRVGVQLGQLGPALVRRPGHLCPGERDELRHFLQHSARRL
eukprot:7391987-Prymnesium_polylepis.2